MQQWEHTEVLTFADEYLEPSPLAAEIRYQLSSMGTIGRELLLFRACGPEHTANALQVTGSAARYLVSRISEYRNEKYNRTLSLVKTTSEVIASMKDTNYLAETEPTGPPGKESGGENSSCDVLVKAGFTRGACQCLSICLDEASQHQVDQRQYSLNEAVKKRQGIDSMSDEPQVQRDRLDADRQIESHKESLRVAEAKFKNSTEVRRKINGSMHHRRGKGKWPGRVLFEESEDDRRGPKDGAATLLHMNFYDSIDLIDYGGNVGMMAETHDEYTDMTTENFHVWLSDPRLLQYSGDPEHNRHFSAYQENWVWDVVPSTGQDGPKNLLDKLTHAGVLSDIAKLKGNKGLMLGIANELTRVLPTGEEPTSPVRKCFLVTFWNRRKDMGKSTRPQSEYLLEKGGVSRLMAGGSSSRILTLTV